MSSSPEILPTSSDTAKTILQKISIEIKKLKEKKKESLSSHEDTDLLLLQEKKTLLASIEAKKDAQNPEIKKQIADLKSEIAGIECSLSTKTIEDKKKFVEQKKTEMIEKIGTSLKEKWYIPNKFADAMTSYLIDEHVKGIKHSGFESFLYGTVGMFLAGLFLPKGVTEVFDKIKNMSLDDVYGELVGKVDAAKDVVKELTQEQVEKLKVRIKKDMHDRLEQLLGRKISLAAYEAVFESWWKEDFSQNKDILQQMNQTLNAGGTVNLFDVLGKTVSVPFSLGWKLLNRLREAGLVTPSEIFVGSVRVAGTSLLDTVVQYGVGSVGLFSRLGGNLFGDVKLSDIASYAHEKGGKMDAEERMMLWGMMYRHGGLFMKVASALGTASGRVMSAFFSYGGDYTTHLKALTSGGMMNDLDTQLKVFDEFDQAIGTKELFPGIEVKNTGMSYMKKVLSVQRENYLLLHAADGAKNIDDIEGFLKKNGQAGLWQEWEQYSTRVNPKMHNLDDIKSAFGTFISDRTKPQIAVLEEGLKGWKGVFVRMKNKINPFEKFSPIAYQEEMLSQLKKETHVMDQLLQKNDILSSVRSISRKYSLGKMLSQKIDFSNELRFNLNTAADAKAFFQDMRTLAGKSPEILKSLFKNVPVILVGSEVLEKMKDPENKDSAVQDIWDGAKSLMPVIGPFMFLSNAMEVTKDPTNPLFPYKVKSWGQAGIAAGLFAYDGWTLIKTTSKVASSEGFLRAIFAGGEYLASPLIDAFKFTKAVAVEGVVGGYRMISNAGRIISAEGLSEFSLQGLRFLSSAAWRIGIFALIAYGGYSWYKGWKEKQNLSSEEEKQLEAYQKNPLQFERDLQVKWPTLKQEEKNMFITLSMAQKLGLQDPFQLETSFVDDTYTLVLQNTSLLPKSALDQARSEVQEVTSTLEKKPIHLAYRYSRNALALMKETLRTTFTKDGILNKNGAKEYILSAGYTVDFIREYFSEYM